MPGTVTVAPTSEDWEVLLSFLPENWKTLAVETGALRGLRKDKSAEALLRTLLIHLGCGHSLRETVVRARQAEIADLSDVALLKRLRKSRNWLYALCMALFQEHGIAVSDLAHEMRAFDATVVSEPGKTGSQWRLHYSVTLPCFGCDFFKLTPTKGEGTAESFKHFPVHPGDYLLADRGYSTANGIQYVAEAGGYVTVRVNTGALHFEQEPGGAFNLLSAVESITRTGEIRQWCVKVKTKTGPSVSGRICVLRKTEEATRKALKRMEQNAQRKQKQPLDATRCFARYVIVFTTFPPDRFSASDVLEGYRLRWQIELVFKRFKSLAQFGHLPKSDEESAKAWLYGKLLVALLTEKIVRHARTFSPWGYRISAQSLERF